MSGLNFATAYIDLALRGQQGVTAALAQMRQQFQQTTSVATTFRNLLNAGPGTRLAGQHLQAQALRAEVRAAEAGAGARAVATPAGRQALGRQTAAEAQTRVAETRQGLARLKAQSAYEATPAGRRAGQEVRDLGRERSREEEARRRRQVINEYGQLGGRMALAGQGLARLAGAAGPAASAAAAVVATAFHLGGLASPAHAETLEQSWDLLMAKLGRGFVPLLEGASGLLQDLSRSVDIGRSQGAYTGASTALSGDTNIRNAKGENPGLLASVWARTQALSWLAYNRTFGSDRLPYRGPGGLLDRAFQRGGYNIQEPKETKHAFPSPFQARSYSYEQHGEALQMAINNQSVLQADKMKDQFGTFIQSLGVDPAKFFESVGANLDRIAANTGNLAPAWRQ